MKLSLTASFSLLALLVGAATAIPPPHAARDGVSWTRDSDGNEWTGAPSRRLASGGDVEIAAEWTGAASKRDDTAEWTGAPSKRGEASVEASSWKGQAAKRDLPDNVERTLAGYEGDAAEKREDLLVGRDNHASQDGSADTAEWTGAPSKRGEASVDASSWQGDAARRDLLDNIERGTWQGSAAEKREDILIKRDGHAPQDGIVSWRRDTLGVNHAPKPGAALKACPDCPHVMPERACRPGEIPDVCCPQCVLIAQH